MKRWRWIIAAVLGAAILGGVVYGVGFLRRTAHSAIETEERLHATILVCGIVGDYLRRDEYRAWPRSWEDLQSVPAREWGFFAWPGDAQRITELVEVDFGVRLEDLAIQSADAFEAIRPNGLAAGIYLDVGVGPLLEGIREHMSRCRHRSNDGPGAGSG